jgi:hypothetical protein
MAKSGGGSRQRRQNHVSGKIYILMTASPSHHIHIFCAIFTSLMKDGASSRVG